MGYYINPHGVSKEAWLIENGVHISETEARSVFDEGSDLPVCLVDNGIFTAAAVAYDTREFQAFTLPDDDRPKCWFRVPREKLIEFYPGAMS